MSAADDHFDAKVTVLIENVTHHIEEEEQEWFPKVREGLGRKQLQDIGARMAELKKSAPRKPTQPKAMKNALDAMTACRDGAAVAAEGRSRRAAQPVGQRKAVGGAPGQPVGQAGEEVVDAEPDVRSSHLVRAVCVCRSRYSARLEAVGSAGRRRRCPGREHDLDHAVLLGLEVGVRPGCRLQRQPVGREPGQRRADRRRRAAQDVVNRAATLAWPIWSPTACRTGSSSAGGSLDAVHATTETVLVARRLERQSSAARRSTCSISSWRSRRAGIGGLRIAERSASRVPPCRLHL